MRFFNDFFQNMLNFSSLCVSFVTKICIGYVANITKQLMLPPLRPIFYMILL